MKAVKFLVLGLLMSFLAACGNTGGVPITAETFEMNGVTITKHVDSDSTGVSIEYANEAAAAWFIRNAETIGQDLEIQTLGPDYSVNRLVEMAAELEAIGIDATKGAVAGQGLATQSCASYSVKAKADASFSSASGSASASGCTGSTNRARVNAASSTESEIDDDTAYNTSTASASASVRGSGCRAISTAGVSNTATKQDDDWCN